jgi:single-strand DNA-binding protein
MRDYNHVGLIGRLTRDAEIKYTSGGMAICNFAVAVNSSVKRGDRWEEEASFFDCVVFGKQAEAVSKYMTKGKQVLVDGSLKQERWEKDGQKRSKVTVTADYIQLLGSKDGGQRAEVPQSSGNDFQDDVPF